MSAIPNQTGLTSIGPFSQCRAMGALALGAGLALPMGAQASLVVSNINHTVSGDSGPSSFFNIDFDGNGTNDFRVRTNPGGGYVETLGGSSFFVLTSGKLLVSLAAGDVVEASDFTPGGSNVQGDAYNGYLVSNWNTVGAHGFVGMRLQKDDGFHYGWLELTRGSLIIGQMGYQTTAGAGAAIPNVDAGTVDEPATLALVAAGAVGIAAMRRRRTVAAVH